MVEALRPLREQGIRIIIYLDDILILASSEQLCTKHLQLVLSRLISLGFIVNLKKSILLPSQRIQFLGVILDLCKMTMELPQDKLTCFRRRIKKLLKKAKKVKHFTLLELQSIVGTLFSVNDCIWATRIHVNSLVEMLRQALEADDSKVLPSPKAMEDLQWWLDNLEAWNGRSMHLPIVDEILEVDACETGLGAIRKKPGGKMEEANKILELEDTRHNNVKELLAAEFGLRHFAQKWDWKRKVVLIKTDNMTSMSYINRMGGKIPSLCRIAERLQQFALDRSLTVKAEWIAGEENVEADKASRIQEDFKESQLNPEVFKRLARWAGPLEIDLFASKNNALLPKFVTLRAHPESYYFDALAHPFPKRGYANPPFILIPRVLQKVRIEQLDNLLLIAPLWTSQAWWPSLLELMSAPPLLLPRIPDLLLVDNEPRLPRWDTVAWRLSGLPSKRGAFRNQSSSYFLLDLKSEQIKKVEACITTRLSGKLG